MGEVKRKTLKKYKVRVGISNDINFNLETFPGGQILNINGCATSKGTIVTEYRFSKLEIDIMSAIQSLKEGTTIHGMVVNACHTKAIPHISTLVGFLIYTVKEIQDNAVVCFSKTFCEEIARGNSLLGAFKRGLVQLRTMKFTKEADMYRMFINEEKLQAIVDTIGKKRKVKNPNKRRRAKCTNPFCMQHRIAHTHDYSCCRHKEKFGSPQRNGSSKK